MKFDEILAMKPPETAREVSTIVSAALSAEDLPTEERDAFEAGYMFGLMFGLMSEKPEQATEFLLRSYEL